MQSDFRSDPDLSPNSTFSPGPVCNSREKQNPNLSHSNDQFDFYRWENWTTFQNKNFLSRWVHKFHQILDPTLIWTLKSLFQSFKWINLTNELCNLTLMKKFGQGIRIVVSKVSDFENPIRFCNSTQIRISKSYSDFFK